MVIYWMETQIIMQINVDSLSYASKEVGPGVNAKETKYVSCLVTRLQKRIII
jgi:hypothetical protein